MHTEVEFAVEPKAGRGKGAAKKDRAAGKTPGVVYGPDFEPAAITFREQDLVKALSTPAARNVFLRLASEDQRVNGTRVIVKELQVDPVKRVFIHADFYALDPNRTIQATVPIHLVGTAVGTKIGGVMQVARRELVVTCLPDSLPESIDVDVSEMKPGDSIHVGDLKAPEGVTILTGERLAVCAVIAPSGYKEAGEGEEEEA